MVPEQVPVVMVPRHTTIAGGTGSGIGFATVPLDVTAYSAAILTVWRGVLIGSPPPPPPPPIVPSGDIVFEFEESIDRVVWTACAGSPSGDPGENHQQQYSGLLTKRWFRVRITLAVPGNIVSCWVAGFLQRRMQ